MSAGPGDGRVEVGGCTLLLGDARERLAEIPDGSVHCCVSSPPYFGLRSYLPDGHPDKEREVGLERTVDAYVARLVEVFREVRRVLRSDGTLWLNLGDSYAGGGGGNYGNKIAADHGQHVTNVRNRPGWLASNCLKPKDLIGVPWMVAFALRADGWWLRSECLWAKPSCMPESVTDRPTRAHETVFLLSKSAAYFYDADAVREPTVSLDPEHPAFRPNSVKIAEDGRKEFSAKNSMSARTYNPAGRNMRSVWTITTEPFKGAHFAVMPTALAERCVKAGTSEKGCCPACGAPWARVVDRERVPDRPGRVQARSGDSVADAHGADGRAGNRYAVSTQTTGWTPTCACEAQYPLAQAVVLDPFAGAGTTLLVASRLQRRGIGIELDERSLRMAADRIRDDATLFAGAAA